MAEGRNIFYRVAADNEDAASELLCNLLRTKYIRDIFLDFLEIPKETHESITIKNISTQKTIEKVGRIDLKIETGDALYFIENKIRPDTGLQLSQTTKYIEYLENAKGKKHKGCVFLLPIDYPANHVREIENIKEKYSFVSIRRWKDLLDCFDKNEIAKESPVIAEVLHYLSKLILGNSDNTTKLTVQEVVIMYNPKDLYNALSFAEKVRNLIEGASKSILSELKDGFSSGRQANAVDEQGWYIYYNNKESIFIGLCPGIYADEDGNFVFSVALKKEFLENLNTDSIDKDAYPCISDEEYIYIKIDREIIADEKQEGELVSRVVDIIKNVFLKNI
jgi:hypothetical protein